MVKKKIALIGLQCGDEGKGVRIAHYARKALSKSDMASSDGFPVLVQRWQGGANAGHTIVIDGEKFKLHQIPSGIFFPKTYNLLGEGVLFNPKTGMEEIQELQNRGVEISPKNFGIASNAHVTLQYHVDDDLPDLKKENHVSTGSGIRQTAVDKYGRIGLRFEEFLNRDTFIRILKEKRFSEIMPTSFGSIEQFVDSYAEAMKFLALFSVLQSDMLRRHGTHYWIGEGAQGFRLDIDKGLYPGVTSSNPSIVPFRADLILGVIKLYESSVGHDRPFVSQMDPRLEEILREKFGERGTTTGKPRDLGWLDAVYIKHAIESADVDYLIGTCGDRLNCLAQMGEKIKIVTGYNINGQVYNRWDKSFHNRDVLYDANPIFEEYEPWDKFVDENGKLTPNAQKYIDRIQELLGREFILFGTGEGEKDVVELKDAFELASVN
ncbi:MAG: adenylosuccinate synthetase [Nanoarchaeota archaeon]|nr:adenylosuccinate synthetase [Nanoarchaeota archaeon]